MGDDMQGGPGGTLFSSRRRRSRRTGPPLWGLGLLVALGLAAGAGWLWLRPHGAMDPPPASGDRDDSPVPGIGTWDEPFVLPPLGASDAAVRDLLVRLSSHPRLASWLVTDDLIRRFVQGVVDISRGSSPVPALEVLIPAEPFSVQRSGERLLVHPDSYRRYDLLAEVIAAVDAQDAVQVYRRLLPLFREAYEELGVPDGPFEEVLARATGNLLAVRVPAEPPEVREATDRYLFSDPRMESRTPAEKHLLRLGPENAVRVQEKLREISAALELPVGAPSAPSPR